MWTGLSLCHGTERHTTLLPMTSVHPRIRLHPSPLLGLNLLLQPLGHPQVPSSPILNSQIPSISYSSWNLTRPWRYCPTCSLHNGRYCSDTVPPNGPRAEVGCLLTPHLLPEHWPSPVFQPSASLRLFPSDQPTRILSCYSHPATLSHPTHPSEMPVPGSLSPLHTTVVLILSDFYIQGDDTSDTLASLSKTLSSTLSQPLTPRSHSTPCHYQALQPLQPQCQASHPVLPAYSF